MNKTRIAILGTIADLHKQPIRYDLDALRRIVAEAQPDLLGVEIERDEFEREELRASSEGMSAALIRGLDRMLTGMQKTANDARRVNSVLVDHTCGLICHLEEHVCGERGRRAWEATNRKMLSNIVATAHRDPRTRILVAVQCRRKHWLEPKVRTMSEIELVNYWEL